MCPTINIPPDVYKRLESHAEGFDTPTNVIVKLLNHYEDIGEESTPTPAKWHSSHLGRDYSQYIFNGAIFGKGKLALAIIKEYVSKNPDVTFNELYDVFPKEVQGSYDVIVTAEKAFEIHEKSGYKRHYINEDDLVQLSDCTAAVTNQWGSGNIDNMINKAFELGFHISPAYVCPECGHQFKGNSWGGIDAHWKANHENIMLYDEAWPLIKSGQYQKAEG